jgi:signal transduction histidine kinase
MKRKKRRSKEKKSISFDINSVLDHFSSLFRFNIRFKIILSFSVQLVFLITLLVATMYYGLCQYIWYAQNKQFEGVTGSFSILFDAGVSYNDQSTISCAAENNVAYLVYDQDFNLVYSYPQDQNEDFNTDRFRNTYNWWEGHLFPDIYQRITHVENEVVYNVVLKRLMYPQIDIINIAIIPAAATVLFIIIFSIRSASKTTVKHLEPINAMNEQVRKISAQNLDTRLDVRGTKDELKDLAYTFNTMLDGISHSYKREQQFVSDASHELRTPIAVIKGYAALLKRWGKDDPEVLNESIDAIVGEVESMQSLVESLLFIARQERGTLEMEYDEFSLSNLVQEIQRDTELIDDKHTLIFEIKPSIDQFGSIDKLKQAFRILVDNSIKYTPDDGIIQVELKNTEKHNIFSVSDTGIGISEEDLPHVFDRFYRADKSRTKYSESSQGGTGLGLSIAKIIIEQHHGRILVESKLNVGTKFSVFLPKRFDPEEKKEKKK